MNLAIRSNGFDYLLIISVGAWATALAYIMNSIFEMPAISDYYWLFLVVAVDVSHVYSSLYRTYLSEKGRLEYSHLLKIIPFVCFVCAFGFAYLSVALFWRVLVYVAVFHFIKQQAGFVRIYSKRKFSLDEIMVYVVTVGAIAVWHLSSEKGFQWFIKNDFLRFDYMSESLRVRLVSLLNGFILFSLAVYLALKSHSLFTDRSRFNDKSFVLTLSTFVAWYFGIVANSSDFIFTFTNVVTHGVPYLALVWHTQKKENTVFSEVSVFVSILLFLAFIEEAFWDTFIWRDHSQFFESFYFVPALVSRIGIALGLALLVLPQLTHYVLDGYIWRSKGISRPWSPRAELTALEDHAGISNH